MKTRAAAALPPWLLAFTAGLAGTLTLSAVRGSRTGCVGPGTADLIAVTGLAGLGLALAALLLVGVVPSYRRAAPALASATALGISVYAMVAFLAHDGAACF